jgi:phosphopantetheine adenylyltransferase
MEYQEQAMQKRVLKIAKDMDTFFIAAAKKLHDYQKSKVKDILRYVTMLVLLFLNILSCN